MHRGPESEERMTAPTDKMRERARDVLDRSNMPTLGAYSLLDNIAQALADERAAALEEAADTASTMCAADHDISEVAPAIRALGGKK